MRASVLVFVLSLAAASAQDTADRSEILKRLDRLEEQNRALMDEIKALRAQIATTPPAPLQSPEPEAAAPLPERVAVTERRVEELDQAKIGSDQKLPVSLTGMVLFNAFRNGRSAGDQMYPTVAAPLGTSNG